MCCLIEFIVKYVLFIVNFVVSLAGLALIGIGTAVLLQLDEVQNIIPSQIPAIPITAIVVGSMIFIVAFLGCCGICTQNKCMLFTYAVFMAILAAAKIALVVVVFTNLPRINDFISDNLTTAFNSNDTVGYNALEASFQCCGTTGAGSYTGVLPATCCPANLTSCTAANAFDGCIPVLTNYIDRFGNVIGIVAIVVIAIEIVGMIFGCTQGCKANKNVY